MNIWASLIVILLFLGSFLTSIAVGDDMYEIHIESDQTHYYQGEQVLISIQLRKNGEGYPGGVCPMVYDPENNPLLPGMCYGTGPDGYLNITDFYLEPDAMLGTYTIFVHAYMDGWEGTNNATFEVVSSTVTAEANGPYQGFVNQPVHFIGDVSGGKPPYTWHWQFSDSGTSNDRNATHSFDHEGDFTALLTVTDAGGNYDDDSAIVIIQNPLYHLSVHTDKMLYFTNENVTISGQLLQNGIGIPGMIHITVKNPNQAVIFDVTDPTDAYGYYQKAFALSSNAVSGEYSVFVKEETLGAQNATTFDVASSTIEVNAHGPYHGFVGQAIHFTGDAIGGATPYTWHWDFNDGNTSSQKNPIYSYSTAGHYTVTLTVNDSYHHVGTDTAQATITESTVGNHTVLIEEGTATWCTNCPAVATILHNLYDSGEFNFYYVGMVDDKNSLAQNRLHTDYNIYGFPTVYIDGGYKVVVGSQAQTIFEDAIRNATYREVPNLAVDLTTHWNESSSKLETTVVVHNLDSTPYNGVLRVYLTEINSRWSDYSGTPYHYAFLQYVLNEPISVPAGGQITRMNTTDATGLAPTNLMVIAGVFTATSQQGYSNPPSGNPFDAYYVDATVGVRVAEGNLPPEIGITSPKSGRIHLFGKVIWTTPRLKTILLGRTLITANASDDSHVAKVEFYIDDTQVANFTTGPYEWMWKTPSLFNSKHTIKAIAYDDQGLSTSTMMNVSAFIVL